MKLYTFLENGTERVGAAGADGIVDLMSAGGDPAVFSTMLDLIAGGTDALADARAIVEAAPADTIRRTDAIGLLAPIPRPPKLRGFSVFEAHLRQSAQGAARRLAATAPDSEAAYRQITIAQGLDKIPSPGWYELPGFYLMDADCIVGPDQTVQWPIYSKWIDYELEIAAVIGRGGRDIALEDATDHIFGYTILNDLSARDAQLAAMATGLGPAKGKDFDSSNVMGPCIVTADEIPDPYAMTVSVRVNGEEWARTDGRDAQFRYDACIEYASRHQTIRPGEMFSTGTWPGCSSLELVRQVDRGATIEFVVDKIGTLRTTIG